MKIAVIGCGWVGVVSATCLAALGHRVHGVDLDDTKIGSLQAGIVPFHEPELADLMRAQLAAGCLSFDSIAPRVDLAFICVGTPSRQDGSADISAVVEAAIAAPSDTVVIKSTVPVGTAARIATRTGKRVVSNPEFLREGSAVRDFMRPDRVVVGGENPQRGLVTSLYVPLGTTIIETSCASAEMAKYAANTMLAARISLMNEVARLCHATGADVDEVRRVVGLDPRIGSSFLSAGIGYGGSCFPKDVRALVAMGDACDLRMPLARAVASVNDNQRRWFLDRIMEAVPTGGRIGILGLAFKPGTDDTREAPGVWLAETLAMKGYEVRVSDPVVTAVPDGTKLVTPIQAAQGADAFVLCTEWPEFVEPDFAALAEYMRTPLFIDGRNAWDPAKVRAAGGQYLGVGRR